MSYGYNTVTKETENIIVIERSKFICNIKPVNDESDARAFIEEIRKRHSLANHCCYAYISDDKGLVQKFSDAGEPQGTAGLPMQGAAGCLLDAEFRRNSTSGGVTNTQKYNDIHTPPCFFEKSDTKTFVKQGNPMGKFPSFH